MENYIKTLRNATQKCIDTKDFEEWGDTILGKDNVYCNDNLRKAFYVVQKIITKIDENSCDTEEQIQELETIMDELYKERCKISDANREKRQLLRDISRTEMIIEEMKYAIEDLPKIKCNELKYSYGTNLEACLLVSDLHYGLLIDNVFNYYDENVCVDRLKELALKTIDRCTTNKVDKLHVEIIGDSISGIIHHSTIGQNNRDIITQVVEVSEILSNFVCMLKEKIPYVDVYCVFGNHGRVSQNKKDCQNKENYERILTEFLKLRLSPNGIKVHSNGYEDFVELSIGDRNIVITHGDKDKKDNAVNNFSALLKKNIDEVHMGHLHDYAYNNGTIVNGSICGADEYAVSLRKNSSPCQILRVYGSDVCTYELTLK